MKCSDAILLIEKDVRGHLADKKKTRMKKHLEDCPGCRAYRQMLEEMISVLQELKNFHKPD